MEYDHLDDNAKRNAITQRLTQLEHEHYNVILNQIANRDVPTASAQFDEARTRLEQAIANLRSELASLTPG